MKAEIFQRISRFPEIIERKRKFNSYNIHFESHNIVQKFEVSKTFLKKEIKFIKTGSKTFLITML